jgi:hypothetical protein
MYIRVETRRDIYCRYNRRDQQREPLSLFEVSTCVFLSIQDVCAVRLHKVKVDGTANGGCGCYQSGE